MVDADYLGTGTGREQHRLVHWRHRRLEDLSQDMHHCTDCSHKPGEIMSKMFITRVFSVIYPLVYFVQFSLVPNAVQGSLKYPVCTDLDYSLERIQNSFLEKSK